MYYPLEPREGSPHGPFARVFYGAASLLGLVQRGERVGFDPLESRLALQQQSRSANAARYSVAAAKFRGGDARPRAKVIALRV